MPLRSIPKLGKMRGMRRHLRALEMLTEVSVAISGQLGSREQVLAQLPQVACDLLNVSITTVGILDEKHQSVHLIASSGLKAPSPSQFLLDELPTVRECVRTGKMVVICDVNRHRKQISLPLCRYFGLRSMMHIPLVVEGLTIGVMTLSDHKVRKFTHAEIRLAELWGAQVAVTIANRDLYQRMQASLDAQKKLLDQRNALIELNASIYRQGNLEDVLTRIVELAPKTLQVDACQVNLLTEIPDEILCAAVTQPYAGQVVGYRYKTRGHHTAEVLRDGRIVVVEDGPSDPLLNPHLREILPCGSLMFVPLLGSDGNAIGALVLLRSKTGKFSQEQLDLVQMFSVRAAAAIESAQLNQQIRSDADTKAMLLRELNHRVKNNLASIVGLLSFKEPDLSTNARRWLDRVIERIRNMASAMDLFGGGLERVELTELIEQALRSLAVVRSPGVVIQTEVLHPGISLLTDRAVSLAMILHELCYNALVHGLGDRGSLMVRAHDIPGGVCVEVIDNGCGIDSRHPTNNAANPGADEEAIGDIRRGRTTLIAPRAGTGIGLDLVRGLVGRELKGHFKLGPNPGGGTIATVEFPLLHDESTHLTA